MAFCRSYSANGTESHGKPDLSLYCIVLYRDYYINSNCRYITKSDIGNVEPYLPL